MTLYIICERSISAHDAGEKARDDVTEVARALGAQPLMVRRCREKGKLDRILSIPKVRHDWRHVARRTKAGDTLIVQFPTQMYPKVSLAAIPFVKSMKRKGVKLCFLIHDLNSLRGTAQSGGDMQWLEQADVVVAHNDTMVGALRKLGVGCPLVSLGVFDYLLPDGVHTPSARTPGIAIAGNLAPHKAGYVYQLAERFPDAQFQLFGPNFVQDCAEGRWYRGSFPPAELPEVLDSRFGLIWDGDSVDTCSGQTGVYLRVNNPHKLSLYLACGMPVMIWDQAAEAKFVTERGLGFAVHDIAEAVDIAGTIDDITYSQLLKRTQAMAVKLRKGYFTQTAIRKALQKIDVPIAG